MTLTSKQSTERFEIYMELEKTFKSRMDEKDKANTELKEKLAKLEEMLESYSKVSSLDIEKLELEIEAEIKKYKSMKEANAQLTKSSKSLESTIRDQEKTIAGLNNQIDNLLREHATARKKFERQTKDMAELKSEISELKKMDAKKLKKNLDAKKKEVKEKTDVISELRAKTLSDKKEKRDYTNTIRALHGRIERLLQQPEQDRDSYLYTSKCGHFSVYPSEFMSDDRPALGDELNYRVIDERDGTSMVAVRIGNEMGFTDPNPVPTDVVEFIGTVTTMAADLESEEVEPVNSEDKI